MYIKQELIKISLDRLLFTYIWTYIDDKIVDFSIIFFFSCIYVFRG